METAWEMGNHQNKNSSPCASKIPLRFTSVILDPTHYKEYEKIQKQVGKFTLKMCACVNVYVCLWNGMGSYKECSMLKI